MTRCVTAAASEGVARSSYVAVAAPDTPVSVTRVLQTAWTCRECNRGRLTPPPMIERTGYRRLLNRDFAPHVHREVRGAEIGELAWLDVADGQCPFLVRRHERRRRAVD